MILFDKKILENAGNRILKRKETIAVAESVTSGLLQFAFSTMPDAALFFQGGITVYNVAQKIKHLQVDPLHAHAVNCVSQKVADEMAMHICELYSSDWGIGITGYASPVPQSGNKVFAFYTITFKNKIKASGKIDPAKAYPQELQAGYVMKILHELSKLLGSSKKDQHEFTEIQTKTIIQ